MASAGAAAAQTFTVTNLSDSGAAGDGSLRGEVAAANANPGADTVAFAPGLTGTITFAGEGIVISDPVDIEGPGPGVVTIRQTAAHRVFNVENIEDKPVTIAGLQIADGTAPSGGANPGIGGDVINSGATLALVDDLIVGGEAGNEGGGIASFEGPLILRSSTVRGNHALGDAGLVAGGSSESWTIESSTIAGNVASGFDGGLSLQTSSTGLIEDSTISGNSAKGNAGGDLSPAAGGAIIVRDSTVAGNVAAESAGGLETYLGAGGTVTIEDSTIAANHADGGEGGGIRSVDPGLTLVDTIVAANTATGKGPDIFGFGGPVATAFSLIGNPAGATLNETVPGSDLRGVDPQLGPLQDNGGPTETMALTPTSPAVDKGAGPLGSDQRGETRPVLYPGAPISAAPGANGADIGAFELQVPSPPPTTNPNTTPTPTPILPPAPPPSTGRRLRVRLSCPSSAKPGGCTFELQVFSAKPRQAKRKAETGHAKNPVAESAVAKVKLGPGHSALVTLHPKPKFVARLAAATKLLVREVETVNGSTRTSYRRLEVVP
jgi:parallel beta-helix repeat protein